MRLEVSISRWSSQSEETSDFRASFVLYSPKPLRTLVIVVMLSKAKEWKKGRNGKSFVSGLKERGLICRGRSEKRARVRVCVGKGQTIFGKTAWEVGE